MAPNCCSLAYLHHLAKAREPLLASLLAIHNVHHMNSECAHASHVCCPGRCSPPASQALLVQCDCEAVGRCVCGVTMGPPAGVSCIARFCLACRPDGAAAAADSGRRDLRAGLRLRLPAISCMPVNFPFALPFPSSLPAKPSLASLTNERKKRNPRSRMDQSTAVNRAAHKGWGG